MSAHAPPGEIRDIGVGRAPVLAGILGIPGAAKGLVIFAHGSGSSRKSPRNTYVAGRLHQAGLATLLLDLLTPEEELDRRNVFDIALLSKRLRMATDWAAESDSPTRALRPCYFGASTGAGAALMAAAGDPRITAIVSRGGRPDLAGAGALAQVSAPTLLLVGGLDDVVIELNEAARDAMHCERQLVIIPRATHLSEEPGTLDQVVDHARAWFLGLLQAAVRAP